MLGSFLSFLFGSVAVMVLGERTEETATILHGLRVGERVVTRANFLIDSESNLRQAITGMAGMPGMQPEGGKQSAGQPQPATPEASAPKATPGPHRH